ncbi:uncharacterized protein PHACADRAFT_191433 [Phanerochaete carnosa HHB-10118-sp]|uniref:H-type lectin domain-containing protein n=1 Tax=Phanerochaete carnosa (strain HHB-10118-sp) TaxID=650164 RepID=K5WIB7_PHACS|nr:uncharacterized protein PHACADRAFT_191433 [Phanerochaete carnosa HHB-10118-sp]EKM59120.1 hypothetical protein PHACADRAFT_191433 [Phanerochaete carnosa HHB-10118-sp]
MRNIDTTKGDGVEESAEERPNMSNQGSNNTPVRVPATPYLAKPTLWFDCGEFRTKNVRSWRNPEHVTPGEARFKVPTCYPRTMLLGFNELDVNILRLKAEVRSIADDRAIVNMVAWANTKHHGSGCSWLTLPEDDPDIQSGRYNTTEDHHWSRSQTKTSRRITFTHPYAAPPKVVVWLDAVDSGPGRNVRVTAWADAVTPDGFTIHLDTWHDSNLWSAGATWLAHSAERTDVRSGAFEIEDVRPWSAPRHNNCGRVSWGAPEVASPPRVFTALRMLDFQDGRNIRLSMSTSEVTTTGMTWHMNSWEDTIFYRAGAVFVTFEG